MCLLQARVQKGMGHGVSLRSEAAGLGVLFLPSLDSGIGTLHQLRLVKERRSWCFCKHTRGMYTLTCARTHTDLHILPTGTHMVVHT